jgi:hypothetical protein
VLAWWLLTALFLSNDANVGTLNARLRESVEVGYNTINGANAMGANAPKQRTKSQQKEKHNG